MTLADRKENSTEAAQAPALSVESLSVFFGGVGAVRNVSLQIAQGERRAVIGTNGAGKTTLFKTIAGAHRPTTGRIELFGVDITYEGVSARTRMGLGRTFQVPSVLQGMSVLQNLQLALLGRRAGHLSLQSLRTDIARQAQLLVESSGLAKQANEVVDSLSHGQRRQLEIEMALADTPPVLMLDEPAAGLAAADRRHLTERMLQLPEGTTLLIIEHDMEVALRVADRVTVMHEGTRIAEGSPDEIRSNPLVRRVYLGHQQAERS